MKLDMLRSNRSTRKNKRTEINRSIANFIDIEDCQPPAGLFNDSQTQTKC